MRNSVCICHSSKTSLVVLLSLLVITEIRSLGTPFGLTAVNWDTCSITLFVLKYLEAVKFEFLQ